MKKILIIPTLLLSLTYCSQEQLKGLANTIGAAGRGALDGAFNGAANPNAVAGAGTNNLDANGQTLTPLPLVGRMKVTSTVAAAPQFAEFTSTAYARTNSLWNWSGEVELRDVSINLRSLFRANLNRPSVTCPNIGQTYTFPILRGRLVALDWSRIEGIKFPGASGTYSIRFTFLQESNTDGYQYLATVVNLIGDCGLSR